MILAALLRVIWLMRNDMCFNRTNWPGMRTLWRKLAFLLAQWGVLLHEEEKGKLQVVTTQLEALLVHRRCYCGRSLGKAGEDLEVS
jgi:hypothetical protein